MESIVATARGSNMRIVLAEGEDPRVIKAASRAAADGLAKILLVGNEKNIAGERTDIAGIEMIDPARSPNTARFTAAYHELRKHRGVDETTAREAVANPLNFAALMVREGFADGTVGGAVATTADTVRAAIRIVGKAEDARLVSSFFSDGAFGRPPAPAGPGHLRRLRSGRRPGRRTALGNRHCVGREFPGAYRQPAARGDAVVFDQGQRRHASIAKMIEATDLARAKSPGLTIDGELQFDAAFIPSVAKAKAPGSPLGGMRTCSYFPILNAGNIAYKIAQRIGGAQAIGPVLQGLARPANDLSRGCSADDVYNMIALTAVQAKRTAA